MGGPFRRHGWLSVSFLLVLGVTNGWCRELATVRIQLDGKPLAGNPVGRYDGKELFVPLDVVRALKGSVAVSPKQDSGEVRGASGAVREVALTRLGGVLMVALDDVAGMLDVTYTVRGDICDLRTERLPLPSPPKSEGSTKPTSSETRSQAAPPQRADGNAKPAGAKREARSSEPDSGRRPGGARKASGPKAAATELTRPEKTGEAPERAASRSESAERSPDAKGKTEIEAGATGAVQTPDPVEGAPSRPAAQQPPVRTGERDRGIASRGTTTRSTGAPSTHIRDIVCEAVDPDQARLRVLADSSIAPRVAMAKGEPMLVVDIPNAVLETMTTEWAFGHPLVVGVRAISEAAPGLTRLLVKLSRLVTYRVRPDMPDGFEIALRLPRLAGRRLEEMTVVIDPGHGGPAATGCSAMHEGRRVYEKALTLSMARKVYDRLRAMGINVIMTRTDDSAVSLAARPELANNNLADLFVSIHVDDAPGNPNASGTTVYYHGSDENSRALAYVLAQTVSMAGGLPNRGARSDMERFVTGMAVLRRAEMPAVLVEVAYISNARDRAKLVRPDFQDMVARAIAEGIRAYVEARLPAVEPPPLEGD